MDITLLQLNFFGGSYAEQFLDLVAWISPDVITLQEVVGGVYSRYKNGDCFKFLKDCLGGAYQMTLIPRFRVAGDADSYFANVTLVKYELGVPSWGVIKLNYGDIEGIPTIVTPILDDPINYPYNVLTTTVGGITIFNTHSTITATKFPGFHPEKMRRNQILAHELAHCPNRWILAGDFNTVSDDPSIRLLEVEGSTNLNGKYAVYNTIAPCHEAWPQIRTREGGRGVNCDNILTGPGLEVLGYKVLTQEAVSDHLPLLVTVKLD